MLKPVISTIENTLQQALAAASNAECRALIETALHDISQLQHPLSISEDRDAALRHERQLDSLYNSAPCGYYSVDENLDLTRINDTLLRMLGYSRAELIGQSAYVFILNREEEYIQQQRALLNRDNAVQEMEYFIKRKDTSVFPAVLNAVVVKEGNGNIAEIRVAVFDITEHKRLENELKITSEQLFQANEAKNKFIGIASHDLQNPITAISMSAELLKKTTIHPTPTQQKLFSNIQSAADRMNYLVSNMLNLNRIERGMVSHDWRTVNLKSLVWDIASRNQIFATRKAIHIHQLADEHINWNVLTEPNYLT